MPPRTSPPAYQSARSPVRWAISVALLVIISVAAFFFIRPQAPEHKQRPVYISLGEVRAYIGGERLLSVGINLEVKSKQAASLIDAQRQLAVHTVKKAIGEASVASVHQATGQQALQQMIRMRLNDALGGRLVRQVLFDNLILAL